MKKSIPSESIVLLTGLAQEINAPLKSVLLSSKKLLDSYKNKNFEYISYKDFKHMLSTLEQMNKEISRCCQTTQRLLDLNKSNVSKQKGLDINEAIGEIVNLLERQMSEFKIKTKVRLQKNLPKVLLSRIDAHQVVHNILTNAIQAMPAGGIVYIRTLIEKKNNMVILEISDEGVGIAPQHLSKVFEPFFTTTEQGVERSSGFGLSIVNSIVQSIGGLIHIQSSLRKGTLVKISLPIARHD